MTTNYEKIKFMSLDEMAELFFDMTFNDFCCNKGCTSPLNCNGNMNECTEGIKQWLQEESEG